MAGLEFKDVSSGGYFDREKEPLRYDENGQPIDASERRKPDRRFENPYDR